MRWWWWTSENQGCYALIITLILDTVDDLPLEESWQFPLIFFISKILIYYTTIILFYKHILMPNHFSIFSVMRPISATAQVVLNKDTTTSLPKMLADLVMDDIAVLVSRQQVSLEWIIIYVKYTSTIYIWHLHLSWFFHLLPLARRESDENWHSMLGLFVNH